MKKANEMRNLANEKIQRVEELKKERAIKWCINRVQREIECVACEGGFKTVVTIPNSIESKYAIDFLKENEYCVTLENRETIEISW